MESILLIQNERRLSRKCLKTERSRLLKNLLTELDSAYQMNTLFRTVLDITSQFESFAHSPNIL